MCTGALDEVADQPVTEAVQVGGEFLRRADLLERAVVRCAVDEGDERGEVRQGGIVRLRHATSVARQGTP